jgi:DNA-binding NtrC family response regulator
MAVSLKSITRASSLLQVELGPEMGSSIDGDKQIQLLRSLQLLTDRLGEASLKVLVSETVSVLERHYIEAALVNTDGNRSAAAKMLGLSRQSLYVKLARYGITSP